MIQKVAVINDLSGFGRCSLTAALPVLSVLGVQCCPLATAVLTAQTGYPHYHCTDLSEMIPLYIEAWQKNQAEFDGIYSGFLTGAGQIAPVMDFLTAFRKENTFFLVDPVMADDGKPYDVYSDGLLCGMKDLTAQADMITPNLTEACLLVGKDYAPFTEITDKTELLKRTEELGQLLKTRGKAHQEVIITGIKDRSDGTAKVWNAGLTDEGTLFWETPYLEHGFSGTGDLFASAMCGMHIRGISVKDALPMVCEFLYEGIADAVREKLPGVEGIPFERHLHLLAAAVRGQGIEPNHLVS